GAPTLKGCDLKVTGDGFILLPDKALNMFDYGVAGFHPRGYRNQGIQENTDNLTRCMEHRKIRIISPSFNLPLDYEWLVIGAKHHNVAMELSCSSLIRESGKPKHEKNIIEMLDNCMSCRVPVIISSLTDGTADKFPLVAKLLNEAGFDKELIINRDAGKLLNFLLCRFN
ncbi:MAG: hypothetical protein PQJ50_08345, partial [Spirochaetales bacterium]|nr:hypothetical protein [Spirochaetales bacterium]